jgi:hypothetical protein
MVKPQKKKYKGMGAKKKTGLPFTKQNYQLFGIGILVLVLGYIAMAQRPWDGFLSLTLAPILLVVGYCVIIPVAILYRKKNKEKKSDAS